jgi:hypothetical protein
MPCLIALLALCVPRVVIVCLAVFTHYLGAAYQSLLWPLLGFFFMPYTTLAYAWAKNSSGSVDGWYLVVVILAVLADVGVIGGGGRVRRTRIMVVQQGR